MLFVLVSRKNF